MKFFMKKFLLGSVALISFAIAIIIFEISCKKEAIAQTGSNYTLPPATNSSLGGIIVGNGLSVSSNGTLSVNSSTGGLAQLNKIVYISKHGNGSEIWTANYDGTNKTKVNYILPTGLKLDFSYGVKLSPDGKKLFFSASTDGYGESADGIFSCNVDGSNTTKIIDHVNTSDSLQIGGAY